MFLNETISLTDWEIGTYLHIVFIWHIAIYLNTQFTYYICIYYALFYVVEIILIENIELLKCKE